jgi:hypothetical protein
MKTALLVGLGAVGSRAARQLVEGGGMERVFVADRDRARADRAAKALGPRTRAVDWSPDAPLPEGVGVVVSAVPDPLDGRLAEVAIASRVPYVSVLDDHEAITARRALAAEAIDAGALLVCGAGLAPGVSDVLARHAAESFDSVDEIRIARSGWAGPASIDTLRTELRGPVVDWHDGTIRSRHRSGEEIVWFPDPIGARDCCPVELGLTLLVDAFPEVRAVSYIASEPDGRVRFHRHRRRGDEAEWGAARVEVWGRRGASSDVVVYGVIDRTAIAAGTMLAVAALAVVGEIDAGLPPSGVVGLAAASNPVALLSELADRGVRAAVFEGAPVAD